MIVVFFAATAPMFAHLCKMGKAAAKDLFMAIHVNVFSYLKDWSKFYPFLLLSAEMKKVMWTDTNFFESLQLSNMSTNGGLNIRPKNHQL